jgi:hypothetical protein
MVYANIAGYLAAVLGGFVLGTIFGRKLVSDVMGSLGSLESRVTSLESSASSNKSAAAHGGAQHAAAVAKHASAIEKLASAVEKHAVAIDEHGAATVAAAVEGHAGTVTAPTAAASKN